MNEPGKFIPELVGRLLALDPANLVVLGTIAFGYALHFAVKAFPREYIPAATLLFTVAIYPLVAFKDGQTMRKLALDVVLALILWAVAWGVHKFILLPLRARLLKKAADEQDGPPPKDK